MHSIETDVNLVAPFQLKTLEIHYSSCPSPILRSIAAQPIPSLEGLKLYLDRDTDPYNIEQYLKLLAAAGASLTTLEIFLSAKALAVLAGGLQHLAVLRTFKVVRPRLSPALQLCIDSLPGRSTASGSTE